MKLTKQDQDAIDHVASVSKNPHAALMVKQLITGLPVEFKNPKGEFKKISYPSWHIQSEYRLIEQPTAKPAYRVWKYKNDKATYTVDSENGERLDDPGPNSEWISDWIEYNPLPEKKQWPTQLVERIAAIDIEAAEWIVAHWDELLADKFTFNGSYSRESEILHQMFDWEESEQGDEYWRSISDKLGE